MDLLRTRRLPLPRSVGAKHALALVLGVLGVMTMATVGFVGTSRMQAELDRLTQEHIVTSRSAVDLSFTLYQTESVALRATTPDGAAGGRLDATLVDLLLPRARQRLQAVESRVGGNPVARGQLASISSELDSYVTVRSGPNRGSEQAVAAIFGRMTTTAQQLRATLAARVDASARAAEATYLRTQRWLLGATLVCLLGSLATQVLISRLGPRIRRYSRFAGQVADGQPGELAGVTGRDELADLGRALNHMVANTALTRRRDAEQAEFVDTLQVTATEAEAHELLQRHLDRSLPGISSTVLTRNNSENRLEAATLLDPGGDLARRLAGSEPRACLATRFARTHREEPDHPPLLSCAICGGRGAPSVCEPLLVSGQVIGSVLVTPAERLSPDQEVRIKNSVAQAAPVLANLRNLALAEFRANNDSLTGLPNKRATEDTLKRMVAQANRSVMPLVAAMLDLDHFKQVNDQFGHAKGDEVLAAVGAALRSSLRASDFAGRFGGEELLVLLPDTTASDAVVVVERIRTAIGSLMVAGVDRQITVSIGVAELVQHSGDAAGLLRQADRALYGAKATGRNRVVVADGEDDAVAARVPVGTPSGGVAGR